MREPDLSGKGNPNRHGQWSRSAGGLGIKVMVEKKGSKMGTEATGNAHARCHRKKNRRPGGEMCDGGKDGGGKTEERKGK